MSRLISGSFDSFTGLAEDDFGVPFVLPPPTIDQNSVERVYGLRNKQIGVLHDFFGPQATEWPLCSTVRRRCHFDVSICRASMIWDGRA